LPPGYDEHTMVNPKRLKISYVTNANGERTSVILPLREFEELLEDLEDLATGAERRGEPTISHTELIAELKSDGLL